MSNFLKEQAAKQAKEAEAAAAVAAKEKAESDAAAALAAAEQAEAEAAAALAAAEQAEAEVADADTEAPAGKAWYIVTLGYPLHNPYQNKTVRQGADQAVELASDHWVQAQLDARLIVEVPAPTQAE